VDSTFSISAFAAAAGAADAGAALVAQDMVNPATAIINTAAIKQRFIIVPPLLDNDESIYHVPA